MKEEEITENEEEIKEKKEELELKEEEITENEEEIKEKEEELELKEEEIIVNEEDIKEKEEELELKEEEIIVNEEDIKEKEEELELEEEEIEEDIKEKEEELEMKEEEIEDKKEEIEEELEMREEEIEDKKEEIEEELELKEEEKEEIKEEIEEKEEELELEEEEIEDKKEIIMKVSHKKNEVTMYEDFTTKFTNIETNNDGITSRRLKEQSVKSEIKGKYLFNIYNISNYSKKTIYDAYVVLLSLTKTINDKEINLGGKDITISNDDDFPFIKFKFNYEGKISNLQVEENYNSTLIKYLYEFIKNVVPELNKELYEKNTEENKNYSFIKENENNGIIIINETNNFNNIEGNRNEKNIEIKIKDNKINRVIINSDILLFQTNNFTFNDNNNFTSETEGNNFATRNSFIKSFSEKLESSLTINSSEINETLGNLLHSIINSKKLINYDIEGDSNLRLLKNNKLRRNDDIILEPFRQPFIFTYPLFNVDFLGVKIGIFSKVAFLPSIGEFQIEFFYNKNGKSESLIKKTREFQIEFFYNKNGKSESLIKKTITTNFDNFIYSIDSIIDNIVILIENNIANKINEIYNEKENIIDEQLNNLFNGILTVPDLSNVFQNPLKELFDKIRTSIANCYNKVYNITELVENKINLLNNSIANGEQINIINIIENIKNDIDKFLEDHRNDSLNIYNASKQFYPRVNNAIKIRLEYLQENGKEYQFDISTFYDIQDIYKKIISILDNFEKKTKDAINIENLTFYNEVNEQFDEILNEPLKNVEIISYNVRNSDSIIDSMRYYWGDDIGDGKRELIIYRINDLRTNINNMIHLIFGHINNTYNTKIFESDLYHSIINNIILYSKEISKNHTSLIEYLRTFVHYDRNFSIYVDDIKSLFSVNYNASIIRKESYKKYIIDELNKIEDNFTTDEFLDQIYNELNNTLNNIISSTKQKLYSHALENCTYLKEQVNNIINIQLSNNALEETKKLYCNEDLLKKMIDNYYSEVIPAYDEFNNTFFKKYFLVHIGEYVSKPTEIITKIKQIIISQEEEKNAQIKNINELIILYLNNGIVNSYMKVYEIVKRLKAEFISKVPKNVYGLKGYFKTRYEEIENALDSVLDIFFDSKGNIKTISYIKSKEDEFSLLEKGIDDYENQIINNLNNISDEIENNFDNYICHENNLVCENNTFQKVLVREFDQFNYQTAKLRDSVSHLKNLIPNVETMMEQSLLNINLNKFLELYSKYNYYSFDIAADLKNYLSKIKDKTDVHMQPFIDIILTNIIQTFRNQLNYNGIHENIENLALKVFSNPANLKNRLKQYLKTISGPKLKIIDLFTNEIEYYNYKGFSLDLVSYENNYKQLKGEIENLYKQFKDIIFTNLTVDSYLKEEAENIYNNIIDEAYDILKDKISALSTFQNFQFLDSEYQFSYIVEEALNQEINNLKTNKSLSVDSLYHKYLSNLKLILKNEIEEIYKENLNNLDYQYNSTLPNLQQLKGTKGNITEISVYIYLKNVFINLFSKIKEIYTEKSLNDIFILNQNFGIDDLDIEVKLDGFMENLNYYINTFQDEARKRLFDEKLEFSVYIEPCFIKAYNKTISDFMIGSGINEMNIIFEEDFSSNIKNQFRYLKQEINNIKDYMSDLLDSPDLNIISKRLSETLTIIYQSINNEFNKIIPPQINQIIYKRISIFEKEIIELIPDKFINNLIRELKSSDFKIRMNNEKLIDLIPKSFPESFKSNLTSYFKEVLNELSLNSFKENYQTKINSELTELNDLLLRAHNEISQKVQTKAKTSVSFDMYNVEKYYEDYLSVVEDYNNIFQLQLNKNKINEIKNLFTNNLLYDIQSIRESFNEQIQIEEKQIENALNDFNYNNILEQVKNELSKKNISEIVSSVNSELNKEMNLLSLEIRNKFDEEMRDQLPKACENITKMEFKQVNENTNRRNLKEYNLNQINDYIKFIENQYKKFNYSVLTNPKFIGIRTKEVGFVSKLINAYNHIDDYFYRYEYLMKEFSPLETFIDNYKNQSLEVRKYIQTFLTEQIASKIDNTINSIKNNVKYGWNNIKKEINFSIKEALDKEFKRLFENLESLNFNELELDIPNIIFDPIEIYDYYQQLLFTVNLEIISSNLKYSYYMKGIENDNIFYFDIDVHTSGNLNVSINTEINGFYKGELKGVLGSAIIGIKPYYYLEDKSVEVNAYVKSQPSDYVYLSEEFDFENWKYINGIEKELNITNIQELNFTKVFRHGELN